MSAPLVSVVIPAYNVARFLPETLDSVLAQTYPAFEVIVVDDGSTDHTAAVAASYAARDDRVRVVAQDNGGAGSARNRGTAESRGDLIALMDGDDLWRPWKLTRQVEAMLAGGPNVGMIYTWFLVINELSRVVGPGLPARWEGDVYPALLLSNFIGSGSTPLIRRQAIIEAGGFDIREAAEDLRLYLAVAFGWRVAVVPEYLVGYRHRGTGASRDVLSMWASHRHVLAEAATRLPGPAGKLAAIGAANACLWLARRGLRDGSWPAVKLLVEGVRRAPGAFVGPALTIPLRNRLRRVLGVAAAREPQPHFLDATIMPADPILADHRRMERWQKRLIARHWPDRRLPREARE